ncbi:uclacyanin 1 [Actinidia rufa]|uniref:Uclacyanin 1 n=1 Tax=Actinidia rufa TaxID=165716 RepID=A0A7J0DDM0_9ERIC|nr:uclacyanin 1 [Actinidia rufa]
MGVLRTQMCLAIATMLMSVAVAVTYTVGSPNGSWDTSTNLQAWATSKSFSVGDNLVFQYMPNHDVNEVSKTDYDSCQTSNPIQTYTGSNTAVRLSSPGKRYFICGTMGHCSQGMKVKIDTLAISAPPPATPPSAETPPTPPPASPATPVRSPPMHSPMSPLSPPKSQSPVSSPASSPVVPSTESPMNSPSPSGSTPTPPPSLATKINALGGLTVAFGCAMVMLLGL